MSNPPRLPLRNTPATRNGLALAIMTLFVLWFAMSAILTSPATSERPYSEFLHEVAAGQVAKVSQEGTTLTITTTASPPVQYQTEVASVLIDVHADIVAAATRGGRDPDAVEYGAVNPPDVSWLTVIFTWVLPLVLIGGFIFFMMRQAQGANNQAFSFGRSRVRLSITSKDRITFADVAGVDEAKYELQEVVEFLKFPEKFKSLGARIPRGVLLVGPPGCGKTILARAVAGEAGVPFFSISGSEFVEMFVGVGANRMRDTFEQAKRNSPSILFIDEIDAVGRQRGAGLGGSHDEREQTLNQMLVEMDGFEPNTGVVVLASTNRPDVLDPALLRPGRFDRQVVVDRPDMKGRRAILAIHARGKPLDKSVDLDELARRTPGLSGADLANLLNEAAILAARHGRKTIAMPDMSEAIDRVIAGPERKSRLISDSEKRIIAYHEGGHAVVQRLLPLCDPVAKVTIVSRGLALGYTMALPTEDRYLQSKAEFEDRIAGLLGGTAAEQLVFGDITTGASNDIEQATRLARRMVTEFGMSDTLGPRSFGRKDELVFLGREIGEQRDYSDAVARQIDEEIAAILERGRARATEVLTTERARLDALAARLVAEETIDGTSFETLFADLPPKPDRGAPAVVIGDSAPPRVD